MTRIRDVIAFNTVRSTGLAKLQPSRPRIAFMRDHRKRRIL